MGRLATRSLLVLALLFGILFAVGIAVLYHFQLPLSWAIIFSIVVVGLQYAFSPLIIDMIFKVRWIVPAQELPEALSAFLAGLLQRRGLRSVRFGIIEDGNPNAFTYGHVPGNARLVVTRGLLEMLDEEEIEAVVAHEVGHITHYDFIVMTFASLVPMLLYLIYVWTRRERRSNQATLIVAVTAYVAYLISQYIVLLLSRVREYYADEHAVESVPNANAISSALIKIAYGLARMPQEVTVMQGKKAVTKKNDNQFALGGAMGICSLRAAAPMAMYAMQADGTFSTDVCLRAMQWDLWNPWARLFEIQSTHPLVARRVMAASRLAERRGQTPLFTNLPAPGLNLWPSFFTDLLVLALPWLGLVAGLILTALHGHGFRFTDNYGWFFFPALLPAGIGWLVRLARSFPSDYRPATVAALVSEIEVSNIRAIPATLTGEIIGRGVPGLIWSKDLVLQDESGFIRLIYRQPLGILETLFGLFKADKLIGKRGTVSGWYRRGPAPYLEINAMDCDSGDRIRCRYRIFLWIVAGLLTLFGAYATLMMYNTQW